MRRTVAALCVLALTVAGCGGADDTPTKPVRTVQPQNTASSPSADPEAARNSEGCRLLTAAERASIAGENLETVVPVPVIKGVLLCKWVESLAVPKTISIKVISQPLQKWVESLPVQIDRVLQMGRASRSATQRLLDAKKKILRGPRDISDAEACRMFSLLVEANTKKKHVTEGILYQGTTDGGYTVSWQKCGGGVHTELAYEEPGLQFSSALSQSVIRLGKVAHRRAVKIL